jgi:GT2 family glycosyltransferase
MARFEDEPSIDLLYGQVHAPAEYDTENLAVPCLYFDKRRTLEFGETFGMGANMSLRKQVFEKVGGYDVCLGPGTALPGAEEGDFCYRAQLAGARVDLDPEVVLVHRATRSVAEWNDVIRVYGVGDAAFHQKHVRCGDLLALRRVLCTILRQTARAVVNPLFRGKGRTDYYLRGYLVGLLRSSRLGVDRERRMYIHPDQYKDVCRPEGTMNRRAVVGVSKK